MGGGTSQNILGGSSQDGRKWLITTVIVFVPVNIGLWDPFQIGRNSWLINGDDLNHLNADIRHYCQSFFLFPSGWKDTVEVLKNVDDWVVGFLYSYHKCHHLVFWGMCFSKGADIL